MMPENSRAPEILPELLTESERWVLERYVSEKGPEIRKALMGSFASSLDIFFDHRARLADRIKKEGGVVETKYLSPLRDSGTNAITCESGEVIYASEVLITDSVSLPVEARGPIPERTRHNAEMKMAFGGPDLGFSSQFADNLLDYRINHEWLQADDPLEQFFRPDFVPSEITITESLETEHGESCQRLPVHYILREFTWGAKLREEFAPDPYLDPEGYAAWRDQEPVPVTEISFHATELSRDEDGALQRRVVEYVNKYGQVDGRAGAEKLLRFSELHNFLKSRLLRDEYPGNQSEGLALKTVHLLGLPEAAARKD